MNINKVASLLVTMIATVIILIYGKGLLIPFMFALFLWFLIREINHLLDKSPVVKEYFPSWLKTTVTSAFLISILAFISKILTHNIQELAESFDTYEANISVVIKQINESFGIDLISMTKEQAAGLNFGSLLNQVFNSVTEILSNTFIILLYAIFIFMEASNFPSKIRLILKGHDKSERVSEMLEQVEKSITSYIGLKTLVSIITGVVSYIALRIIGVDSPAFWAFLIFILNYIPTIGSLAATLFPATFALLQFGELMPSVIVLIVIGTIQLLVGNILEPKLMGRSLNISALVAIIALSFWGALWGVTGMILSVPITVIMVIVFSKFESTKAIAILLSEKGHIE